MKITKVSTLTGKEYTLDIDVTQEQIDRFEERRETGEYIQNIMSNLSNEDREFILSGITPQEWDDAFGEEE